MSQSLRFCVAVLICWNVYAAAFGQDAKKSLDFNRDIKPILSNNCFHCHGPDANERKGGTDGLRLDTAEGATGDLGGHAAIVPGKPEASELLKRVTATNNDEVMPPKSTGKKLSQREIETLTQWIRQGAPFAAHWSYTKPLRQEPPNADDATWNQNPIDRFLWARLKREGLRPQPEADRYALARRVSLDLTGLPPSIQEVDAFVNDKSVDAYEKFVDQLLKKETYGEQWAHLWLDLARYADSAGYADDPPRTIWLYRDYVIRSLNANKPFDQFSLEQIAGDLLPNPTDDQLTATAFHRNTLTNNEGGTNDEEFRNVAIVDRVNTTMAVWMGTTMACAQCHNHKYDPISQEEFFRVFAIFNNTDDADRRDESPLLSVFSPDQLRQRSQWQDEIARLETKLKTPTPEIDAARATWEQSFPTSLKWQAVKPASVTTKEKQTATIADDGSVLISTVLKNDTYTAELPLEAGSFRALRLEALPHDALPAKGPGHSNGNFVLSKVTATIAPPEGASRRGRFVRIMQPGKNTFLSLAEVQIFSGEQNVALGGEASQLSTDFDGPAKLAIDGNTNGDYFTAKSTTHTAAADNPWWEVDLKSEQSLDRIAVWNRTDGGGGKRLVKFQVQVLNEKRDPIWEEIVHEAPNPSVTLALNGSRTLDFTVAVADYTQTGFDAADVLANAPANKKDAKQHGWAIGPMTGKAHSLTLVAKSSVEVAAGSRLVVTLEQNSPNANHLLGHFRFSTTDDGRAADWARAPANIVEALQAADARTPAQQKLLADHYQAIAPALDADRKQLADVKKQLESSKPDTVPVMKELAADKRRVTKIQHRGNFLDLGKEVTAGLPTALHQAPASETMNRLTLAKWLVDDNNPLTPRVIANRFWEQIFGVGIVSTSEEFGSQGELPVHPELLDWLATELIRLRWDMKSFVRLLVTSAAYKQSSLVTPDLFQRDPENRLLARGPRFRLSAEMVRDQALFAGGLLSSKMYGPPVKPPQPSLGLSAAFGGGIDWQTSGGDDKYRRGLYTTWRRSNPYPSMAAFDAPNREVCTVRRVRTNTPLQALVTLNDPVYIEAAQALARRVIAEGGATPTDRVRHAFRLCLSRPPREEELARLEKLFAESVSRFEKDSAAAAKMANDPLGPPPAGANVAELAAWTVVGNVLMNLDETLMKR